MKECPEIVVYRSHTSLDVPMWTARLAERKRHPTTQRLWWDFLPMIFSGDSSQEAEAAARQFWSDETAKIASRASHLTKAREARQRMANANVH